MSDINSGMSNSMSNNMFLDSEVAINHSAILRGGNSDDYDSGDGGLMKLIAVAMGCVAALVLLYIVRQHTDLPEKLAMYMEKKLQQC